MIEKEKENTIKTSKKASVTKASVSKQDVTTSQNPN